MMHSNQYDLNKQKNGTKLEIEEELSGFTLLNLNRQKISTNKIIKIYNVTISHAKRLTRI